MGNGKVKTVDETAQWIADCMKIDEKNGLTGSLNHTNFGLLCWVYNISAVELYDKIIQAKAN